MENRKLAMTVEQVATELGISKPIAYDLVRSEGFPALRVGRRVIIPRQEFEQWLSDSALNKVEIATSRG